MSRYAAKLEMAIMQQIDVMIRFNSFQSNFRQAIFKLILVNGGWGISYEIALRWMPLELTDDKSTLVQVMAWFLQATSHYLRQCWSRPMSPYGVTRPQWVNLHRGYPSSYENCITLIFLKVETQNLLALGPWSTSSSVTTRWSAWLFASTIPGKQNKYHINHLKDKHLYHNKSTVYDLTGSRNVIAAKRPPDWIIESHLKCMHLSQEHVLSIHSPSGRHQAQLNHTWYKKRPPKTQHFISTYDHLCTSRCLRS